MLKKLIGGILLCGIVVPASIISSITDGAALILTYIGKGLKWATSTLLDKSIRLMYDISKIKKARLIIKNNENAPFADYKTES